MTDFDDFKSSMRSFDEDEEVVEKHYTLVFCFRPNPVNISSRQILLGMKKRGFGVGKWNGFGGKIEQGETVEEGAYRELQEESSLHADSLVRRGYFVFNMKESKMLMRVHVFTSQHFSGEPTESDEMRPQWFDVESLPFELMWPDDQYWMPLLLKEDKVIMARFDYEDDETISDYSVKLI